MCAFPCVLMFMCICDQVIEVLVRSEQGLFREVVKHLNQVEEQVLESLAWTSNSPLWESLRRAKDHVPACQEVRQHKYYKIFNLLCVLKYTIVYTM